MLLLLVAVVMGAALNAARLSATPVLALLALAGGLAWRAQHRSNADRTGIDKFTGLFERAALLEAARGLAERAPDRPVSIIVLDFSELREVHEIYGAAVTRKLIAKVVRRVEALAGRHGLAGRTGTSQFTVILPAVREEKALRAVQRVLGKPARIEFDAGDSEIVLVPELIVDSVEAGDEGVELLHRTMCRELAQRQNSERLRQQYLTRERERHSRPMSLPLC